MGHADRKALGAGTCLPEQDRVDNLSLTVKFSLLHEVDRQKLRDHQK